MTPHGNPHMRRPHRILAFVVCALVMASTPVHADIERSRIAGSKVMRVRIADPSSYWQARGFREMTPPIRVSVAAYTNARTVIYLKIDNNGNVTTRPGPDGSRTTRYPPGSESDRVSLVLYRKNNGTLGYTVTDVRGIRWDKNGQEYFHVYRASGPEPHAPLIGYEWPRDNARAAADATERLTQFLHDTPLPNGYASSESDIRRFQQLNRCQACHWPEKRGARLLSDRMPPWATDSSGLYTPLAVLYNYAPLSAESSFHDPNSADPYIRAHCGSPTGPTNVERLGSPGGYYYRCPGMAYPIGVRDFTRAIREGDLYSQKVCGARGYLYRRMDENSQRYFASAMRDCGR